MKARIKATGEIVSVQNLFDDGTAQIGDDRYVKVSLLDIDFDESIIVTKRSMVLPTNALILSGSIDWGQRRYELAKDISCAYLQAHTAVPFLEIAKVSVKFADELITQLKEKPTINSD